MASKGPQPQPETPSTAAHASSGHNDVRDAAPDFPLHLPLRQAILTWCKPDLVAAVRREEVRLTEHEHAGLDLPLLCDVSELAVPHRDGWMAGHASHTALRGAWDRLFNDLRRKVEGGELFLEGVRLAPEHATTPEEISSSWAADMKFDLDRNTVQVGQARFGAITVSTRPSPWQTAVETPFAQSLAAPAPSRAARVANRDAPERLTVDQVASLSDDVILVLLEEHARRVIDTPDAKLIAPGKISLMPIIRRKMLKRANDGELLSTLAAEGLFLAEWIAGKVEHHQVPSQNTITKVLGREYGAARARSNDAIRRSKSFGR
jgi:hypothetical protein